MKKNKKKKKKKKKMEMEKEEEKEEKETSGRVSVMTSSALPLIRATCKQATGKQGKQLDQTVCQREDLFSADGGQCHQLMGQCPEGIANLFSTVSMYQLFIARRQSRDR